MKGEFAVLGILRDDATVSSYVGTRVYLDAAKQTDPLPYVIVEEENVEPFDSKDGVSVIDHDIIRVYPYAENKNTLRLLAQACRNALDGKAAGTYNTVVIQDIKFRNQSSFDEEIENRKVYAKDQEYIVRVVL